MDFTNKVVVVTGASAGIGEATALQFAKHSAKLVLVARNVVKLKEVAARCERARGLKPLWIAADVTSHEDVDRILHETRKHFARVDVLVNNAGAARAHTIMGTDMKVFDETFAINVRAAYQLTVLFMPMLLQSKGNVVNVSSIGSTTAAGCISASYSMAKAALDHFTKMSALEFAPMGVRVNTVSPGLTFTDFQKTMLKDDAAAEQLVARLSEQVPLGNGCQSVEIADAILYLSSDLARSVTGSKFVLDGGLSLTL